MKKILLIEDDQITRDNTAEMLQLASFEVVTAEDGKAGVTVALAQIPDLIICDISMPELDGYGVLHMLSRNPKTAGIPFIFLTSKTEKTDVRKGMGMGADDYLTKPFEEMDLLTTIEARINKNDKFKKGFERTASGINKLLDSIKDQDELKKLSGGRKPRLFKKKEVVFLEGDEATHIMFISNGKIKTYKATSDGKELITGIHKSGDFIGALDLMENNNYMDSATAIEDSEVMLIPKQEFYTLIYSNRDLAARFIHLLSNDIHEMEERMLNLAYSSVRKRIADGLLTIQQKYAGENKSPSSFFIPRDDFASLVGISPETVSRTLHEFISEKLIQLDGKDVLILNREKLQAMKN